MRVTLMAIGTRGDVQPLAALGVGLQKRGHQVRLVAGDEFADLVTGASLEFVPIGIQLREVTAQYKDLYRLMAAIRGNVITAAGTGQDAIVSTFMGMSTCTLSRSLSVPFFYAMLVPTLSTRVFSHPIFPPLPLGGAYNALTYNMADRMAVRACDDVRCLLADPRPTYLGCFSPQVVVPPGDWGNFAHVTGYWFMDSPAGYQPPPALEAFLRAGPPPVVVSFGSTWGNKPERTVQLVLEAIAQSGQRAVLLLGWRSLPVSDAPSNVFIADDLPYEWLLSRAAAVVHHGGAGTTAASLLAGIPSVVVPMGMDQPFWARRLRDLGTATDPLPRKNLTSSQLARAIRTAVENPSLKAHAAALGAKISTEDGVRRAVEIIERDAR